MFVLFTGTGAMLLPIFGDSVWLLWLFILLFTPVETTFPAGWAVVADFFGRTHFARIRGYMGLFYPWGGVVGPVVAGMIYDRYQTYEPLLWTLIVTCVAAGVFYGVLSKPWKRMHDS